MWLFSKVIQFFTERAKQSQKKVFPVKLLYPSEAPKRGVDPVSILPLLISALRLSNNRTISIWPEFTAYWRGVRSAYIL